MGLLGRLASRVHPSRRALAVLTAVCATGVVLAACTPEPPAPAPDATAVVATEPAPTPTSPPPTTAPAPAPLPTAPGGSTAPSLSDDDGIQDAPDPFVLAVDPQYCAVAGVQPAACYFAYTTQVPIPPFGWILAPVWRSTDLATWRLVDEVSGTAITTLAPWVEIGYNWAPSVLYRPGNPPGSQYVMWYTARLKGTTRQCIGVATAPTPLGPFVDTSSAPAYCQSQYGGTIDASPFVDNDGTAYLLYKSEFPARLWISELTADGRALVPGTEHFLWEASAATGDDPVVEAPTMVRNGTKLYLFYSTDDWWTRSYRVGVVTCSSVSGPCTGKYSTAVLASRGSMVGPGGQTPFRDLSGAWRMAFHAWTDPYVGYPTGDRSLRLLPLTFGSDVRIG